MLGWPMRTQDSLLIIPVRGFRYIQSTLAPGEGGGGVLNKFLYGEVLPRGRTPCPFMYHFLRNRYPFRIPSIDKWYSFSTYLV